MNNSRSVFLKYFKLSLLSVSTIISILTSIWCLDAGFTIIFQNLFYIPIILACVFYLRRGFIFSILLALLYLLLIIVYTQDPLILVQAFIRVLIFTVVAGILTFLSIRMTQSEEKYHSLFTNMLDGFTYCQMIYDSDGTPSDWLYLDVNEIFTRNIVMNDVRGKRVSDIFPAIHDQSPDLFEKFNDVIVSGIPVKFETFFSPLAMWLRISAYKFKNDHFVAVFENITEQKQLELAIRENEEKFSSVFAAAPDPLIIVDPTMQITEVNISFEKVFGLQSGELEGLKLEDTAFGNIGSLITSLDMTQILKNQVYKDEMTFVNQSGSHFIADVTLLSIPFESTPFLLIQIHDIDELRRTQEVIHQVNNKLKILSSITRHDILNRIMVTSSYSEMLKQDVTDPNVLKKLNAIYQSSEEIKSLIQFTGQYQDMGSIKPSWQKIELILKIRSIQGLVREITLNSDLGDLEIYADRMLEKVIYNLVENSIRHGRGVTTITFTFHQNGSELVILYEDNGGGIPSDEKEKVFERGFGKNTGLGLFLIREILSITDISIMETGELGIGVRFEMRVPAGKFRIIR